MNSCVFVSLANAALPDGIRNLKIMKLTGDALCLKEAPNFLPAFLCPEAPVENDAGAVFADVCGFLAQQLLQSGCIPVVIGAGMLAEHGKHEFIDGKKDIRGGFHQLQGIGALAAADFPADTDYFCHWLITLFSRLAALRWFRG